MLFQSEFFEPIFRFYNFIIKRNQRNCPGCELLFRYQYTMILIKILVKKNWNIQ